MTALTAARDFLAKWSAADVVDFYMARLDERLPGSILRRAVVQVLVRNIDLYASVLGLVADGRGSIATMLSRPQLETAAYVTWAGWPHDRDEQVRRLTRIVTAVLKDSEARYPAWRPEPAYVELMDEAKREGLGGVPTARNAMEQVDAERRRHGEDPFFDSHYSQFQLASSHLHSLLFGPAVFSGPAEGPVHWSDAHNVVLARSAQRYGTQYFVLSWQGLWMLAGAPGVTQLLQADARPVLDLADQELLEVATPTAKGWTPR